WVDGKPILSLIVVGIIATQLGTYFGYVFPAFGLPPLPWPLYNGILGTTIADGFNGSSVEGFAVSSDAFFVGHSIHFVNGIVFAVLWGIMFREDVPIKRTFGGNIIKGLLYGVIMTIISAGLLVPYAYVPNSGYGLFLFDGPDGWKLPFAILIWHLIYGVFLGLLYQPTRVDYVERAPSA
ncbi:MAG TPA: hypothetical protein VFV63_10605, partial [Ilumatobacteraceae bacterium]|nr:hypothetical protein [Ilumatobacteraceae bacterium]